MQAIVFKAFFIACFLLNPVNAKLGMDWRTLCQRFFTKLSTETVGRPRQFGSWGLSDNPRLF
jgi:hypothetical protein